MRENKGSSILSKLEDYVVVDIETTGLDPYYDKIIEISAVRIHDSTKMDSFNTLVNPEIEIDSFITELTGITNDMVKDAPLIDEAIVQFKDFVKDSIIVGHNVNFDINFLYDNMMNILNEPLSNDYLDTMRLSRKVLPELPHHRLKDLAKYYNLDYANAHRAYADVEITYEVYSCLVNTMAEKNILFEQLITVKKPSVKARYINASGDDYDEENYLFGKNIVITGVLEKMQRKEAMQYIADIGGINQDKVNKETNILIQGNNEYNYILKGAKSNKVKTVEELIKKGYDIEILSENLFYECIEKLLEKNSTSQIDSKPNSGKPMDDGVINDDEKRIYNTVKEILIKNNRSVDDIRCNLNASKYFDVLLFYPIIRVKVRGKKKFIVIDTMYKDELEADLVREECPSSESGKFRLIFESEGDLKQLEKYILFIYDYAKQGNDDYRRDVGCGEKNYISYLQNTYE